jgi:hypothetical protein
LQLNAYCKLNNMPHKLVEELRGYLFESTCVQEHRYHTELLDCFSDALRSRVIEETTKQLTDKVFLFYHTNDPDEGRECEDSGGGGGGGGDDDDDGDGGHNRGDLQNQARMAQASALERERVRERASHGAGGSAHNLNLAKEWASLPTKSESMPFILESLRAMDFVVYAPKVSEQVAAVAVSAPKG